MTLSIKVYSLNSSIKTNVIEAAIKNFPNRKRQGPNGFSVEFYTFKE